MAKITTRQGDVVTEPAIARFIFSDTRMAWLWLIVRLYMAYTWLTSGYGKITNPAWTQTGAALKGFWVGALAVDP